MMINGLLKLALLLTMHHLRSTLRCPGRAVSIEHIEHIEHNEHRLAGCFNGGIMLLWLWFDEGDVCLNPAFGFALSQESLCKILSERL